MATDMVPLGDAVCRLNAFLEQPGAVLVGYELGNVLPHLPGLHLPALIDIQWLLTLKNKVGSLTSFHHALVGSKVGAGCVNRAKAVYGVVKVRICCGSSSVVRYSCDLTLLSARA